MPFGPPELGWMHLPDPKAARNAPGGADRVAQPVMFRDLGGTAVFEGCILIGKTQALRQLNRDLLGRRNTAERKTLGFVIVGDEYRWSGTQGSYTIKFIDAPLSDPGRAVVSDAMAEWQAKTPLRFQRVSTQDSDTVVFRPQEICASYVGRQGGSQEIWLAPGATAGNAMHEIGHLVGLWHEHTRPDRDSYVRLVLGNIEAEARQNFAARSGDGQVMGRYDFDSVMHYGTDAFAIDPSLPTIVARNGEAIGQRKRLSPGDTDAVSAIYP